MTCGSSPSCLLHDTRRNEDSRVYVEDTVACPLRFWGFRHIIELPPQQANGSVPPPVRDKTTAPHRPRLTLGMHGGLPLHERHLEGLRALLATRDVDAELDGPEFVRDRLLDRLNSEQPDLVYLYCHAEGGADTGIVQPVLRFRPPDSGAREGRIRAAQIAGSPWDHHPLVVLNGCRTAAYRPDALSPFIERLTMDRHAAGVLATEIAVWEQLAGEVALHFLSSFVAGEAAGESLRSVRRALLAKRNPLGLAYTLYAHAGLRLVRAAV